MRESAVIRFEILEDGAAHHHVEPLAVDRIEEDDSGSRALERQGDQPVDELDEGLLCAAPLEESARERARAEHGRPVECEGDARTAQLVEKPSAVAFLEPV